MLEPHRTSAYSTLHIVTGKTRCAGCLCPSSGWFTHREPHRTHLSTDDCTEPSLPTSVQGQQGVQDAYALRSGSSASNLLELHRRRDSKVCRVFSHTFRVVRLYGTLSTYIFTASCEDVVREGSMRFDVLKPPQTGA